jgi:folylpolyglutamate synthase/dihydropteroate synthase
VRAAEADDLARRAGTDAHAFADVASAYDAALAGAGPDGLVVVAGSLYLVGTFKAMLQQRSAS